MAIKDFFIRGGASVNTQVSVGNSSVNAVTNSTSLIFQPGGVSFNTASIATAAQFLANTAGKILTTDQYWGGGNYVGLTDAATIAVDLSTGINFTVTLGASRTLGFPTNLKQGQSGFIEIVQPAGGGCTLSFGANYHFDTGTAPSVDTGANHKSVLAYHVRSSSIVYITMPLTGAQ